MDIFTKIAIFKGSNNDSVYRMGNTESMRTKEGNYYLQIY